jgi:ribosomal protein S18 acetylase RimI-like enzyme
MVDGRASDLRHVAPKARPPEPSAPEVGAGGSWTEETRDVGLLRAFLLPDKERGAYFLGDLDPRYFHATRWFVGRGPQGVQAVVMRYDGHSVPGVHVMGDPAAARRVLLDNRDNLPPRFDIHAFAEIEDVVKDLFPGVLLRKHLRMRLLASDVGQIPERDPDVLRLTHADTADLMQLYQRTGVSYFDPYQVETGLYFGIRQEGALVSVAGVHVVSEEDKVAVIGNVATHPDWRGQGLSTRCTTRLLRALLRRRVETLVLNVDAGNGTAVHLYRELGFADYAHLYTGRVGGSEPAPYGR